MEFPCDKCGCCCEFIGCNLFDADTRCCKDYDNRPLICNVKANAIDKGYDLETRFKQNKEICKLLQNMKGDTH